MKSTMWKDYRDEKRQVYVELLKKKAYLMIEELNNL